MSFGFWYCPCSLSTVGPQIFVDVKDGNVKINISFEISSKREILTRIPNDMPDARNKEWI